MNTSILTLLRKLATSSTSRLSTLPRSARGNSYLARFRSIPTITASFTKMAESVPAGEDAPKQGTLPKLSASEFRAYNSMAEHMEYFVSCHPSFTAYRQVLTDFQHNRFRASWNLLYGACESNKRPSNISIRQFLSTGLDFCSHLEMHHNIEEQHIFPVLAKKMPAFRHELQMRSQHKEIHAGLVVLQKYLEEVRSGERELILKELKVVMDGFGKVLWQHLDDEVEQLGAENMRTFWTIDEMRRMPM
jgi:hemerythrin-like domain-containing protein